MGVSSIRRGRGTKTMAGTLQDRADNYRRFIPDWPALWQSFERQAKALRVVEGEGIEPSRPSLTGYGLASRPVATPATFLDGGGQ